MDKDYKTGKSYLENIKDTIDETCDNLKDVFLDVSALVDSLETTINTSENKGKLVSITRVLSKITEINGQVHELMEMNRGDSNFKDISRDLTLVKENSNPFCQSGSFDKTEVELLEPEPETAEPCKTISDVPQMEFPEAIPSSTFINPALKEETSESFWECSSSSCVSDLKHVKEDHSENSSIATPTQIPEKYEPQDVDKARENLKYFERKISGDYVKKVDPPAVKTEKNESDDKVNEWLRTNEVLQGNVIEKFTKLNMKNPDEEVRRKAIKEVPEIEFIEVASTKSSDKNSARKKSVMRKMVQCAIEPPKPIEQGDLCYFKQINSPGDFYIQVVNEETGKAIDKIDGFTDPYKQKCPFSNKAEACEKLGDVCVGFLYEQNACYRFEVLDWKLDSDGDDVNVFAVDFGFTCLVSYTVLRGLAPWMAKIPKLAVKCHLYQLYPPGSTFGNRLTEWEEVATRTLISMANLPQDPANLEAITIFQICWISIEGDSSAVDMEQHYTSTKPSNTVGGYLIEMGLAVEIVDDYEQHPELGEFLHEMGEAERTDTLGELLLGYDASDEKRICKFAREDGTCYKGKNCQLEHTQLQDFTTDKIPVFYQPNNENIPPVRGQKTDVIITYYIDSCTYYAQMIKNPVQMEGTMYDIDSCMASLMSVMNHPRMVAQNKELKIEPAVGEILLALHPGWNKWVRAKVAKLEETYYLMYVVDFGETLRVNKKNVREMRDEFMDLPFQAIEMYLKGHRPTIKSRDSANFEEFFQKHMFMKNFVAEFLSDDEPYNVLLTTKKGNKVDRYLCSFGFAQADDKDIHISSDKARNTHNLRLG